MSDNIRFWYGAPESLALDIMERAVRDAFRVARIPEAISQDATVEGLRRKLVNGILEYAKQGDWNADSLRVRALRSTFRCIPSGT